MTSDEEIIEMSNGCICCVTSVRTDLLDVVRKLVDRVDHILIEASGLADPMPIAQAFFLDDPVLDQVALDAIVTLVDAKHIEQHLDDVRYDGIDNQAVDQIVCADRIIINKVDLVDDADVERIRRRIEKLNERAEIAVSSYAEVNLDSILGIEAFELSKRAATDPGFLDEQYHHSHDPAVAVGDGPCARGARRRPCSGPSPERTAEDFGPDLLRWKGIVALSGEPRKVALQGVHQLFEIYPIEPWGDRHRDSRVVFIGTNLERDALEQGLIACKAPELTPTGRRSWLTSTSCRRSSRATCWPTAPIASSAGPSCATSSRPAPRSACPSWRGASTSAAAPCGRPCSA